MCTMDTLSRQALLVSLCLVASCGLDTYGLFDGNGLSSGPSHCEGVFSYNSEASLIAGYFIWTGGKMGELEGVLFPFGLIC